MLAYEDKAGKFKLTKYGYLSKGGNEHLDERALELDHYPPWNKRLKKHEKDGTSVADRRADYQDESKLRALCTKCNGNHKLERTANIPDYDSDAEDFDPKRTPKHETQYNTGAWSGYRDPVWLN